MSNVLISGFVIGETINRKSLIVETDKGKIIKANISKSKFPKILEIFGKPVIIDGTFLISNDGKTVVLGEMVRIVDKPNLFKDYKVSGKVETL